MADSRHSKETSTSSNEPTPGNPHVAGLSEVGPLAMSVLSRLLQWLTEPQQVAVAAGFLKGRVESLMKRKPDPIPEPLPPPPELPPPLPPLPSTDGQNG